MSTTPPPLRSHVTVRLARACAGLPLRLWRWLLRWGLVILGVIIVCIGLILGPLPGPGGIPIIAVGLVLILRGSITAKKGFARLHRRYPRFLGPIRRMLRWRWKRSPETSS
ncbi:MAG: hypothetical protein AAF414_10310 [Pseudomonadota bacterium]